MNTRIRSFYRILFFLIIFLPFMFPGISIAQTDGNVKVMAISMKAVEMHLMDCVKEGNCSDDVLQFYGMKKVLGFIDDKENNDIILIGEYDDYSPQLYLEDFVVALRNAWMLYAPLKNNVYQYSPPGCSIDPEPYVLQELEQIGDQLTSNSQEQDIKDIIDQWHSACLQDQNVRVIGVPNNSRFAQVLVYADYHMKKVVNGSVSVGVPGFSSLTDMILGTFQKDAGSGKTSSIPKRTMNRFWFCPGENSYIEDDGIVLIKTCNVNLLSEEEYLSEEGQIEGKGRPNQLAKKFSEAFSDNFDLIASSVDTQLYFQLKSLFRFVAIAKLLKFKDAFTNSGINPDFLIKDFLINEEQVVSTLPGIHNVNTFKWKNKDPKGRVMTSTMWLPSCGGVKIDISIKKKNIIKDKRGKLKKLKNLVLDSKSHNDDSYFWDVSVDKKLLRMIETL